MIGGALVSTLLDGRKKKVGLWDSLFDDDKKSYIDKIEDFNSAKNEFGDQFDFAKLSKGWDDIDQSAMNYFRNLKEGKATEEDLAAVMNRNRIIPGRQTREVQKGLWSILDDDQKTSYKNALKDFNKQGSNLDLDNFTSKYKALDASALDYFKT